jgi:hypothetical protein
MGTPPSPTHRLMPKLDFEASKMTLVQKIYQSVCAAALNVQKYTVTCTARWSEAKFQESIEGPSSSDST